MDWTYLVAAGAGFLAGVLVVGLAVRMMMPGPMFSEIRVPGSFDEVTRRLEQAVSTVPGWGMPMPPFDMTAQLAEKGVPLEGLRRVKLYFVCNPRYAAKVVGIEPRITAMMPCTWAVYERPDGDVRLTTFNMDLMRRVMPGEIGRFIAQVARDERAMKAALLGRPEERAPAGTPGVGRAGSGG